MNSSDEVDESVGIDAAADRDDEMCCDPDYDPARGGYVHAESCQGTER